MRVFLSWSGDLSRRSAEILRKYLPCILQGVDAFMSKHDLESGSRWSVELAKQLDESSFGILCLTPDNLASAWVLFEAGALTKHVEGRACGMLIGELKQTDVSGPLSQFQNRMFIRDDVEALVRDINARLEKPLEPQQLKMIFEKWWPDIQADYEIAIKTSAVQAKRVQRTQQDILEEILTRIRSVERNLAPSHGIRDYIQFALDRLTEPQKKILKAIARANLDGRKDGNEVTGKQYMQGDLEALFQSGFLCDTPTGLQVSHKAIAEMLATSSG